MSHFHFVSAKLKLEDLPFLKEIFKQVAELNNLDYFEAETRKNWYNVSQFLLVGLGGENVNPLGLIPQNQELSLVADLETGHHSSDRKEKTEEVYTQLTQQLAVYRAKKARDKALEWASQHTEANVNVKVQ